MDSCPTVLITSGGCPSPARMDAFVERLESAVQVMSCQRSRKDIKQRILCHYHGMIFGNAFSSFLRGCMDCTVPRCQEYKNGAGRKDKKGKSGP